MSLKDYNARIKNTLHIKDSQKINNDFKAALGVTAGGLALGAAALNRKRIARGISKLNNKLKFYRDKRNSGPIIAKIKQMIRKLQDKLQRR